MHCPASLRLSLILIAVAASYAPPCAADAPRGRFRVFLLAGQSNMVGQGQSQELPEQYRRPHARIRIWTTQGWKPLVPQGRFGPEVAFAHHLADAWPNDTIGVIKVAIGGTGILAFVPDWSREQADRTRDGHKGPLYKRITGAVEQAQKVSDFDVEGFVWKQGGKDMRNPETAKEYLGHFERLVAGLRNDTGVADLPAFISTNASKERLEEFAKSPEYAVRARGRPGILDVMRAHHEASEKIPHVRTVVHGKLPTRPDGIHFNTEGQLIQGRLLAEAVAEHYRNRKP